MNHHLDPKVESGAHVGEDDRTLLDVGGLEVRNSYHLSSRITVRDSQSVQLSPSPDQRARVRDSFRLSSRRESKWFHLGSRRESETVFAWAADESQSGFTWAADESPRQLSPEQQDNKKQNTATPGHFIQYSWQNSCHRSNHWEAKVAGTVKKQALTYCTDSLN
jgi:hypothetical protein